VAISSLTSALFIGLWGDAAKWLAIPVVVMGILLLGEVIPRPWGSFSGQNCPGRGLSGGPFRKLVRPLH
jgi:Mg2+/Co2+ transporter CorB